MGARTLLYLVTEDWYFRSHRLPVARAAQAAGYDVVVACRAGDAAEAIRAEGFRVAPLGWRRTDSGLRAHGRALREIVRLYKAERPALCHHVALKPVMFGTVAARLARVPAVINAIAGLGGTFTLTDLRSRAIRLAIGMGLRGLARKPGWLFLFQNADDERALVEAGIVGRDRTVRIPGSGVDTEALRPLPPPTADIPTVAVVSRMLSFKGIADAVAASEILHNRGVAHRLALHGLPDPDNRASVPRRDLEAWDALPQVRWCGHAADVRTVWAEADIALLASHGGEGLPKSLLEAAACGRPLVATDVPGCRDVARAGINAELAPPRDPAALAEALERLIVSSDRRRAYGAASRHLVETELSAAIVAQRTLALYRRLAPLPGSEATEGGT